MNGSASLLRVPEPKAFLSVARACKALAEARTMLDAKKVKDVAEAMRVWARAQKEGQGAAQDAAEIVLRSERRLGELSAALPKATKEQAGAAGGRGKAGPKAGLALHREALADVGITKQRAAEYERIAAGPEDQCEELISSARAEQKEITTASALRLANGGRVNAKFSSESVEWYTPAKYIEAARHVLGGIDLDPASSRQANETVKATNILTVRDNGLEKPWEGRVWLNPPYALIDGESSAGKWGAKLIEEYRAGRCTAAVLLVNAVTDARWFQPFFDFPICFTYHRIEFYTPSGQPRSPVSGNAFVYFGEHVKDFARAFDEIGRTVMAVRQLDRATSSRSSCATTALASSGRT